MLEAVADRVSRPDTEDRALGLLLSLLASLHRQGIAYCYWKSTAGLDAVLAGEADFDLLAARTSQGPMMRALVESGFKLFPSVAGRDHPSILSFLGYDAPSGRIVHVHLHFGLATGERLLRNYCLPWVPTLLACATLDPTLRVRVLDAPSEAVLLAVRACLELRALDPVTLRGWRAARRKFADDQQALAARVGRGVFRARAAELVGEQAAELLTDDAHAGRHRGFCAGTRRRVRRELAEHRMYNAVEARLRAAWRALHWLAGGLNKRHLHLARPWSRRAPGGGCVVALLGVDGSGKTTAVAALRHWLGTEVDVMPIYFGTGDGRPSLPLLPLKLMAPLFTRLLRHKPRGSSHGAVSDRAPGRVYGVLLAGWATVLAVEKRSKLRAAHRGARRGMVVAADRYPQDQVADYNDGPLLPRLAGVPSWLRRFEARSYALARRLPPDLTIKLEAPPETLAAREPGMDRRVTGERVGAVRRLTFGGARVVRVDATQPLDDVLRAVKAAAWSLL